MPRWSKLSKVTKSREKCKRKACFSFHFRDEVTSPKEKLRKVVSNTKNKIVFYYLFCRYLFYFYFCSVELQMLKL